jgi:hypothetical protein
MVALDWVDAASYANGNVRARDFIPFKSTIDKLRGKGAPTPDQAFEFYSKAYQDVASRLGNPIMYSGKIGEGSGDGLSSMKSTINVHPMGVDGDNYSAMYDGINVTAVPVVRDIGTDVDLTDESIYTITLDGTGLSVGDNLDAEPEYEGGVTDRQAALNLLNIIRNKAKMSEYKKDGVFTVHSTVSTAYDGNKSAYTFVPSKKFVEENTIVRNAAGEITKPGLWEASQAQKIMQDPSMGGAGGVTVMAKQGVFKSDMYNNNFQDKVTAILDASKDKTYTIKSDGATLTWRKNEAGAIEAKTNVPLLNVRNYVGVITQTIPKETPIMDFSADLDKRIIHTGDKSTDEITLNFIKTQAPKIQAVNQQQMKYVNQLLQVYNSDGSRKYTNEQIIKAVEDATKNMYGN